MTLRVKLSTGEEIQIDSKAFASGGEGDIHLIVAPERLKNHVVKIYHNNKRTKQKEDKITFLINNRPVLNDPKNHASIIWPTHTAYLDGKFAGYTMPKAGGIKLELLCHSKLPKTLSSEWSKFDLRSPDSLSTRLKVCYNISAALATIHSYGTYVLVDLKPDNIIINADGLISIIDIDSTEIVLNNNLLFPAHVNTPEYTPPEYYSKNFNIQNDIIKESWDNFSISVILYRLLFGIHPFTATLATPFEKLTLVSDIIAKGFLPIGNNSHRFKVIPPPHKKFTSLEPSIQANFIKSLETSASNPDTRTTASDWCRLLAPIPNFKPERKLPSELVKCFSLNLSQKKMLPNISSVSFPRISISDKIGKLSTLDRIKSFIGISAREQTRTIILRKRKELEIATDLASICQNKLKQEHKAANLQIKSVYESEVKLAQALRNKYQLKANALDEKAKSSIADEESKYKQYFIKLQSDINGLELQLKSNYDVNFLNLEKEYQFKYDSLNRNILEINRIELKQIENAERDLKEKLAIIKKQLENLNKGLNQNITKELKDRIIIFQKNKKDLEEKSFLLKQKALEAYQANYIDNYLKTKLIYDARGLIFDDNYADPDSIYQNLNRSGILTAADIKGVDAAGRILKSNGAWVKVPEVAKTRADKLDNWRKKMERTMPTSPPQQLPYQIENQVTLTLKDDLTRLIEEEKELKQQIIAIKSRSTLNDKEKMDKLTKQESDTIEECQALKKKITIEAAKKRNAIRLTIDELKQNFQLEKSNKKSHYDAFEKKLKDKKQFLIKTKDEYFEKVESDYDIIHQQIVRELKIEDDKFQDELAILINGTKVKVEKLKNELTNILNTQEAKIKEQKMICESLGAELSALQNKFLSY